MKQPEGLWVIVLLLALAGCKSSQLGPDTDGSAVGVLPHISAVDVPNNVTVGSPATFTLHLTSQQTPEALTSGFSVFTRDSVSFEEGKENGAYLSGQFRGVYVHYIGLPGDLAELGAAAPTIPMTVVFDSPGVQHLYVGHARTESDGGLHVTRLDLQSMGYPPEGEHVEYLDVPVTVNP